MFGGRAASIPSLGFDAALVLRQSLFDGIARFDEALVVVCAEGLASSAMFRATQQSWVDAPLDVLSKALELAFHEYVGIG